VQALAVSLQAARDAQALSGLAEALRHLEQVLDLWDEVAGADDLAELALPAALEWAAELAAKAAGDGERPGAVDEAREAYPLALLLVTIALRESPLPDASALEALRAANERLRVAVDDLPAAIAADHEFHARLVAGCRNDGVLAALRSVKGALARCCEEIFVVDPARIERVVAQHEAILEALERGDRVDAGRRLREDLIGGLPALAAVLDR
jgi:hypothetical protein